jgi:putative redox protein
MNIKPKTTVTLRLKANGKSHAKTEISVRDQTYIIDEPVERGGTNQGPAPTETLLGALAGCTHVVSHKIAARMGVEFQHMDVEVISRFDRRGVILSEDVANPFPEITLRIKVVTAATEEQIEAIKTDLEKFCPVSKVFRAAGTRIEEIWEVVNPQSA